MGCWPCGVIFVFLPLLDWLLVFFDCTRRLYIRVTGNAQWLLTASFLHAVYEAPAVSHGQLEYLQLKGTKIGHLAPTSERDVDESA